MEYILLCIADCSVSKITLGEAANPLNYSMYILCTYVCLYLSGINKLKGKVDMNITSNRNRNRNSNRNSNNE